MNIVVFGAGANAYRSAEYLQNKYNILWYVDNDDKKVGTTIGEYEIKSPKSLEAFDGCVIITVENHTFEIANQLRRMGINSSKILTTLCTRSGELYLIDVYPIDKMKLIESNKELVEYDLLRRYEDSKKRRILVFAKFYSVYAKQLVENLHKEYTDIELSILTSARETKDMIENDSVAHIYFFSTMQELHNILYKLPQYDVAQLLWIEEIWAYFSEEIRSKFNRLNLCVGGSDFYRASKEDLIYKKKLIDCADNISAETTQTISDFAGFYGINNNEIKLIPFGLEVINYVDKIEEPEIEIRKKFGIPLDKIVVTCGHNAIQAHQHLKLIESLKGVKKECKDKVIFVFPMTYPSGRTEYINKVTEKLEESDLPYKVITEFMDFRTMAQYALLSDIMIHVQTTDQLSSTMLEEMYTGSVVIAGEWLPYKMLHDRNIYFLDAESIQDAVDKMEVVVKNIEEYKGKCAENKNLIWKNHSWNALVSKWYELLQ